MGSEHDFVHCRRGSAAGTIGDDSRRRAPRWSRSAPHGDPSSGSLARGRCSTASARTASSLLCGGLPASATGPAERYARSPSRPQQHGAARGLPACWPWSSTTARSTARSAVEALTRLGVHAEWPRVAGRPLAAVAAKRYDLVFMDGSMPRARRLRGVPAKSGHARPTPAPRDCRRRADCPCRRRGGRRGARPAWTRSCTSRSRSAVLPSACRTVLDPGQRSDQRCVAAGFRRQTQRGIRRPPLLDPAVLQQLEEHGGHGQGGVRPARLHALCRARARRTWRRSPSRHCGDDLERPARRRMRSNP